MSEKQFQIVFSLELCNELLAEGFKLKEVKFHQRIENASVFFFENSEHLQKAILAYMAKKKKEEI